GALMFFLPMQSIAPCSHPRSKLELGNAVVLEAVLPPTAEDGLTSSLRGNAARQGTAVCNRPPRLQNAGPRKTSGAIRLQLNMERAFSSKDSFRFVPGALTQAQSCEDRCLPKPEF